jgi:uncharacterized protein (TIGR03437 family)
MTGAPDEGTCTGCHYTYELNSGMGTIYLTGLPTVYTPEQIYNVTVTVTDPAAKRWGFELTSIDKNGSSSTTGELTINDAVKTTKRSSTVSSQTRYYISHYWANQNQPETDGSVPGKTLSNSWSFNWTAPAATAGDITFYATGNAADNGVSPELDYIHTTSFIVKAPSGLTGLSSYVELRGSTSTTITAQGVFDAGAKVLFNNQEVSTQTVAGGLSATIPANLLAIKGVFPVTVKFGAGAITNALSFAVAESINGLQPTTVEAASYQTATVPGQLVSSFGTELIEGSMDAFAAAPAFQFPLPQSLGKTSIYVNGVAVPMLYVNKQQANFQLPYGTATGTASLVIYREDGLSARGTINVGNYAPAVFTTNQQGTGQAVAQNSANYSANDAGNRVKKGSFVTLYGTGTGNQLMDNSTRDLLTSEDGMAAVASPLTATATKPTATIGGKPAQISFSGLAPGFVGLWQVNIKVPADAPSGAAVEVIISHGDKVAKPVTIAIE